MALVSGNRSTQDRVWNKIEHRLFSFISINWCAHPLTSLETVIELISQTTTEEGLQVTAIKDSHTYPTGISVTDAELGALNIVRDAFHGEWNYTIKPQESVETKAGNIPRESLNNRRQ